MQDNFTNDVIEILTRYMDGELSPAEKEAAEKLLQNDAALRERYQHLLTAKQAIRSQGLKQRVQAVHRQYMLEVAPEEKSEAKVIKGNSFFKTLMRVAAVLLIVIAGYGIFQYVSATNQALYSDAFIAYQLPVNRSSEQSGRLETAYSAGNYTTVINLFNATQNKSQRDYFIAAQAYLQLGNATAAIDAFRQVENMNSRSSDQYFVQETDYYLLLAYIKANKIDPAEKQLDKITANKQHLFYSKAKAISRIRLALLKWKE